MKISNLTYLALIGLIQADHRCDDMNTAETNAVAGPLARALAKAKADMDAAQAAKELYVAGLSGNLDAVKDAQENEAQAKADYQFTLARVSQYHDEYQAASQAFAACKPDDPGSTCDANMQAQLQLRMVEAGNAMIDNDTQHNTNVKIYEQMTKELNKVQSEYEFDSAATNTSAARLDEDLSTAAQVYQKLKDDFDQHTVTGTEAQEDCMINQYHNDMAEINRLTTLLNKCRQSGCTQQDLDTLGYLDISKTGEVSVVPGSGSNAGQTTTFVEPESEDDKKYLNGPIRFPDCGPVISEQCFWLHYNKSGWLDFLSFFGYIPALIGCAVYEEYDYGLCLGNFAYILTDAFSKKIAPFDVPDW